MSTLSVSRSHAKLSGMDLDIFAEHLGVHVMEGGTPHGWWGYYDDRLRLIVLRPGLGPHQRRSTLAHELGHAFYRHTHTVPAQERQADAFAAQLLVTETAVDAAAVFNPSVEGIAAELGVMPWVIRTHLTQRPYTRP